MPVFLAPVDLAKNELRSARVHNLAAAPASPVAGQLYYDTAGNRLYYYNGTAWVAADGSSVAFGAVVAETSFGMASSNGAANTVARSDHAHGNPAHGNAEHAAVALSALAAPITALSLGSQRLIDVADPTTDTDGVNKRYADLLRQGIRLKDAVRVATTANIDLTTGGLLTVDGVTVAAGNRVLVKNQTTASQNGIYLAAAGAWTRAGDADTAIELGDGTTTFVAQGTSQADTTWTQINALTDLTSAQQWAQQGAAISYLAGAGLVLNANTFDVVAADGSITVNPDSVTVGNVPVTKGGTGATAAAGARANLGAPGRFSADLGSATTVDVVHNLGTRDVVVQVRENASPYRKVYPDVDMLDANTVRLTFTTAPAAGAYRATVIG